MVISAMYYTGSTADIKQETATTTTTTTTTTATTTSSSSSSSDTVSELKQESQQTNQVVNGGNDVVQHTASLKERRQVWQALDEQNQKQLLQQKQQSPQLQQKTAIVERVEKSQRNHEHISNNNAGIVVGGYYGLGKIPKSPSFHSGLDLLADDSDDRETNGVECDSKSTADEGGKFATLPSGSGICFRFGNIEELKAKFSVGAAQGQKTPITLQTQKQQQTDETAMSSVNSSTVQSASLLPTTITTTTTIKANTAVSNSVLEAGDCQSTDNCNKLIETTTTTTNATTIASMTITSTLVATLAQQFSSSIKATNANTTTTTATNTCDAAKSVRILATENELSNDTNENSTTSLSTAYYKV